MEAEAHISHLEDTLERLHIADGERSKMVDIMWDRIPQKPQLEE